MSNYNDKNSKIFFFFQAVLEENMIRRTKLEARKVAGSSQYKQSKQYEIVLSFTGPFFYSLRKTKRICLGIKMRQTCGGAE